MLTVNINNAKDFLPQEDLTGALTDACEKLEKGTGAGNDFIGWVHLPRDYDREEFARIQAAAKKIQSDSQALVVIGIGGSYLGARAVIELMYSGNYNLIKKSTPDIYFVGNGLSADGMQEVIDLLGDRDFSINVISKSGTTTEPAVAFRIFKAMIEEKYGKEEARRRIYATTDKARGALKGLADTEGYETFVVPDDVGGRFSVLTAVGLLPIAVAGVDIQALMDGARTQMEECMADGPTSPSAQYAAARYGLYKAGKSIEILACYEPAFRFFAEWWKQLYGESEGKEGKGLFPASVEFTADLHSMGRRGSASCWRPWWPSRRGAAPSPSPTTRTTWTGSTSWRGRAWTSWPSRPAGAPCWPMWTAACPTCWWRFPSGTRRTWAS